MKKLLLILISTIGFTSLLHAQTDVLHIKPTGMLIDYENNSTHDASALLQLGSDNTSTQGFLAPRVALTAANVATPITTPATGLLIFNTTTANTGAAAPPNDITPGYYYNAGSSVAPQWVRLITGGTANAWTLTGNTGTTASTAAIGATVNNNFIGTTDAKDFVMATSNLERMRITSNGNVGIGTITPASKLHINHAFTSDLNERAARIITSNTQTITASRQLTGLYVEALNRQTETTPSGVTPTSSLVYALDGVAYTNDTRTFNWLRGGNFTAYSTSTSATDQDAIAGSFSHGYFNAVSPGAATSVYGAYNQGSNNNTGSISSGLYGSMNVGYNNNTGSVAAIFGSYNQAYNNSTGAVTTAYGSYNRAFINTSSGDLTNAYGTFNYVFKNSNATGTITNAYGTFSQVTNAYDAATGSIPTGYAYYGTVTKATNANDYTNAYGIRLNVAAGVTRWGVYTENEHKNYFSGNVGITASSPVSRLDLGSALAANKPLLRYNPGVATAVDYTGYAHHDFLLGGYVTGGYSQNYISFGHNTDINRKFHIGSASNSAFDGTTTFVPAVTVMSGGNVGIGTQTPGAKLAVNGVTSVGAGEKLSLIGLDINSGVTPNFIKIITTIPAASGSADFTVNIKGFRYGSAEMTDLTIGWHWWTGTFYNPSVSSSGSWAPVVRLSAEGGFVAIVLSAPGYWPKLYVESMYSSAYNDQYSTGWSWTDADASGSPIVTVPYKSNFGNDFVMLSNGNVGIGTSAPTQKLDVNGQIRMRTGANTGYIPVSAADGTMIWTAPGSIGAGDNLGNHTATTTLEMAGNTINNAQNIGSNSDNLRLFTNKADDVAYEWLGFYSGATRQGIILYDGAWNGANSLTNEFSISSENNNKLTLNTNNGDIALMPKVGNVGIGTLTPGALLQVGTGSNRYAAISSTGLITGRFDDNSVPDILTMENRAMTAVNHGVDIVANLNISGGAGILSGQIRIGAEDTYAAAANQDAYMTLSTASNGTLGERIRIKSDGNVGIGTTAPLSTLDVGGTSNSAYIQNMAAWGLNARTQGLMIMPEGTVTDDGAGNLTFGGNLIVMNPLSGSYIRVAAGTYALGSWGTLYVNMPPTSARGTVVTPAVTAWADGDRNYDGRDRILLAQRNGGGRIWTAFGSEINATPRGIILLWSGSVATIPSGWALCNGASGTPDLRDRFVVGAGNSYAVAATGGATTVTLAVGNLPSHTHTYSDGFFSENSRATNNANITLWDIPEQGNNIPGSGDSDNDNQYVYQYNGRVTSATGSGTAFDIRPPYYALCYIMKL